MRPSNRPIPTQATAAATTGSGAFTEIVNSTISGNSAQGYYGGGIYNGGDARTEIYNSTIYGNSAGLEGGGIWEDPNVNAYVSVRNTILSNNTAAQKLGCRGLVYSYRGNLVGSNNCALTPYGSPTANAPDQLAVSDVKLGSLTKVGASVQWAHTPLVGSPALDKISASPNYCYRSYDQLSTARPRNAKCDVGAIER